MLPLGWRVFRKVAEIIREEMDAIGGQEFQLPTMHPASLEEVGPLGGHGRRDVPRHRPQGSRERLGMTEEEVFAVLAAEITSYKALPQIWYQIHTKFRDEPRPKSGLLRVREFTM